MPDNDKPGILRNLRIKRVAIVDQGANFDAKTGDGAHIMLYKSSPGVAAVHVPTAGAEDDDSETDYEKANLDASARNALPDSAFAAVWTDAQGKKHRKLPIHDAGHLMAARGRVNAEGGTKPNIPAAVLAEAKRKIDAKSKKEKRYMKLNKLFKKLLNASTIPDAAARQAEIEKLHAKVEKDGVDDGDEDDYPMHKSDDPMCKCADCMAKRTEKRFSDEIEKATAPLKAELAKAQETLRAEIEKRDTSEVTEILKGFRHTSFDMVKDVPMYLAMKRNTPELFTRTMEILKGQDAQLADSAVYKDFGSRSGAGEGSAWGQIEAKADQMIEKSKDTLTHEQALEKVMLQNPKLVAQYRREAQ